MVWVFSWKEGTDVWLASLFIGHIDIKMFLFDGDGIHFTGFYGNPKTRLREHFLELLKRLKQHLNKSFGCYKI